MVKLCITVALIALMTGSTYPRTAKASAIFKDCDECPEMVVVPAGLFRMGDPNGGEQNQFRVQVVNIPQPFAVGVYEVTRGEFAAFVNYTGHDASGCFYRTISEWYSFWRGSDLFPHRWKFSRSQDWRNHSFNQTDRDPVVCVNYNDARAYIRWLSRMTGKSYRLLSEAEWEYVARAGSTSEYPFGDSESELCEHGNGADRSTGLRWRNEACSDGYGYQTAPVGSFQPNGFGVYDTVGNVSELVLDPSVVRGGSWYTQPRDLRSSYRRSARTRHRVYYTGFRVARTEATVPDDTGFDEGLAASKRGDYATALRKWRPLAEHGHANAQLKLGNMYRTGQGVPQDHVEAAKWYQRAAEQGNAVAQMHHAAQYVLGQGVVQDYVQAHMWAHLAAAALTGNAKDQMLKLRGNVTQKMTAAQLAKAQDLARKWTRKHRK